MHEKVIGFLVAAFLGLCLALATWFVLAHGAIGSMMGTYEATPARSCREGYTEGMSAAEVSALMQISLIEFDWLPSDIAGETPDIYPHGLQHFDDSGDVTCVIRVEYPNLVADILSPQMQPPVSGKVNCFPYEPIENSTRCWGELETTKGFSVISMFLHYPVEIAQRVADSIELIDNE
jgi:hypothetical protein